MELEEYNRDLIEKLARKEPIVRHGVILEAAEKVDYEKALIIMVHALVKTKADLEEQLIQNYRVCMCNRKVNGESE